MKSKIKIILSAAFLIVTMAIAPHFALAATTNGQDGGFVPCGNTVNNPCTVADLFRAFIAIVNYLIVMAGFVAVLAIIYAGFMMVTSQGAQGLAAAKKRLSGAIFGMFIVAAAFILVNALFAGSLSIGVKNGAKILSDPRGYINGN